MDDGRWQRVKELFSAAIELPAAERARLIERAAADDCRVRSEVLSLLAAYSHDEQFLETPPAFEVTNAAMAEPRSTAGSRTIGAYRLLQPLGRGGMGVVYLAERADDAFRKRVAIKLIHDCYESQEAVQRFQQERQVLAELDHPNIARLLDGGMAADGSPYLVMEYVDGLRIDEYCSRSKLTIGQRVALFQKVCAAVQAAHRSLVVHRDIKPSNILVSACGEPKLVDFGIAKLLDQDRAGAEMAATGTRIFTPAYAAPEQLRGQAVTTSTDIYSLGVLLYWLLTDQHPFELDGLSAAEVERVVCEQEPSRPSVRCKSHLDPRVLRGDLDRIVLLALDKEPLRRYPTVEALVDDLERWQRGAPVRARPLGQIERSARWVRRHRSLAASLAVTASVFVAAFAVVSWQLWHAAVLAERLQTQTKLATENGEEARRHLLQVVRAVNEFAQFRSLTDDDAQRQKAYLRMVEQFRPVVERRHADEALNEEIAATCFQVARIGIEVLHSEQAWPMLENASRLYQELAEKRPRDARLLAAAGRCLFLQGSFLSGREQHEPALAAFGRSRELFLRARQLNPADQAARQNLIGATGNMAITHLAQGDPLQARAAFERVLSYFNEIRGERRLTLADRIQLGETHAELAKLAPADARLPGLQQSLDIRQQLVADYPNEVRLHHHLACSLSLIAAAHVELAQWTSAKEHFTEALKIMERTVEESPLFRKRHLDLSETRLGLGRIHAALGEYPLALPLLESAALGYEKQSQLQPLTAAARQSYSVCLNELAQVYTLLEAHAEAAVVRQKLEQTAFELVRPRAAVAVSEK